MYKNYKSSTNSHFFFVVVAIMACVLIVAGLVASHGALFQRTGPKDTQPPVTDPAPGIPPKDTGSAEDTTTGHQSPRHRSRNYRGTDYRSARDGAEYLVCSGHSAQR